ncbi:uncharacterized protein GGS25DRAFT_352157 [Hypoxylon fragiforme]|uniref:uncharacterized protein n=1 Tax=Hypoxylon fragiforme TaxID=63214 RepID=UPI0020C70310|nr:uncharacterized protein GGS25DRAFT_352157 [Hypoxylon fragiforme]KAI2605696.1 hypothetical protein GGS25DRAFT_352157 [Hypoxylon fragiforme]
MDSSRKRASTSGSDDSSNEQDHPAKRQRSTDIESRSSTPPEVYSDAKPAYEVINRPTAGDLGREGLKRSIALTLQAVGFDSAKNDALENFTELVDTYTMRFMSDLRRIANGARRNTLIPTDFETVLHQQDVELSALKPHLKHPIPKELLEPSYYNPVIEDTEYLHKPRPYLGEELSGQREKEERPWIPKNFPPPPPPYTYRFTPIEQTRDISKEQAEAEIAAKKGEVALRRINRAARISRQKELNALAERDLLSKQRHHTWESMMGSVLPEAGSSSKGGQEIADNSTIVNFGGRYGRKGVPKTVQRT